MYLILFVFNIFKRYLKIIYLNTEIRMIYNTVSHKKIHYCYFLIIIIVLYFIMPIRKHTVRKLLLISFSVYILYCFSQENSVITKYVNDYMTVYVI